MDETICSKPPNILVIIADDLGYGNVGFHQQNGEINTPNIDYLAQSEGLILERHYVHYCCSPTRTSFQSGRLPIHVNLGNGNGVQNQYFGVSINMTVIASKLKNGKNYTTHLVGKWDAGLTTPQQIPIGRGYDSSFGYLGHSNNYWTESAAEGSCGGKIIDLWEDDHPAYNINGTQYEEFLFAERVYNLIDEFGKNKDKPFFLVYTPHLAHNPLQIPKEYLLSFDNDENQCSVGNQYIYPGFTNRTAYKCRSTLQSMVNLLDIIIGNITTKLKGNGLYNNTLILFTADNGGEEKLNATAGNNWPLRGAKFCPLEGGIRSTAFVSGGILPNNRKTQKEYGMIHISDWYSTFCALNGIDPTDTRAKENNLPPIDSLNVWDLISGKNETSPRDEIIVDMNTLINGKYKLIINQTVDYASWTGPIFPNSTSPKNQVEGTILDCYYNNSFGGCLFNVVDDWTEHENIAKNNPDIVNKMNQRLLDLQKTYFKNNVSGTPSVCPTNVKMNECGCWTAQNYYGGYYGPWQNLNITKH